MTRKTKKVKNVTDRVNTVGRPASGVGDGHADPEDITIRQGSTAGFLSPWLLLIVFIVAVIPRTICLMQLEGVAEARLLLGDAAGYHRWAAAISSGQFTGTEVFYQAPLYPYLLGLVYWLFGQDLLIVRIVQALLGAMGCVALAIAAGRLSGPRAALIAGVLAGLYPPAIFFDMIIQKTSLATFLFCLLIAVTAVLHQNELKKPLLLIVLGLITGLLGLTRENAMVLVPVIAIWLGLASPVPDAITRTQTYAAGLSGLFRRRLLIPSFFLIGLIAALLPVSLRNYSIDGSLTLTTSQFGPNFFVGNNERATGMTMALRRYRHNVAYERDDARELAEQALQRKLSAGEVSRYWTGRALDFIFENPREWFRLMGTKFLLLINDEEIADTEDIHVYKQWCLPLKALGHYSFSIILVLAVWGAFHPGASRLRRSVFPWMLAAIILSVTIFYVFGRYRFSLVPPLILFAAAGWGDFQRVFQQKRAIVLVLACLSMLGALTLSRLDMVDRDGNTAVALYNIGAKLLENGQEAAAESYLHQSLDLKSTNESVPMAWLHLGIIAARREETEHAADFFRNAIARDPSMADAHERLGMLLMRGNYSPDETVHHLREAVRLDPRRINARVQLGVTFARQGDFPEAKRCFQTVIDEDPQHHDAIYNLALVSLQLDEMEQAEDLLRTAIALVPDDVDALLNLGVVLARSARYNEAIDAFSRVLRIDPRHPLALSNLELARTLK